ncbi:MAG: hypothetical protein R2873_09765 [Caldilineaceae bacterium]
MTRARATLIRLLHLCLTVGMILTVLPPSSLTAAPRTTATRTDAPAPISRITRRADGTISITDTGFRRRSW